MATLPTHFNPLPRRLASALAGLALGIVLFLCAVTSASANSYLPRTYESQLAAGQPEPLAIDSANRIWVDPCSGGCGLPISEFNPLGERLPVQIFGGSRIEGSIAADHSNDVLYVPDTYQSTVSAYSATGALLPEKTFVREGHMAIAADNSVLPDHSPGPTAGRLYLTRRPLEGGEPSNIVELLSESGEPIDFPRYDEPNPPTYIKANKLTGTPSGPFTSPHAVAVGPHGELYVADSHGVDEFEPSGEFLREISGSEVPGAEFNPFSLAVDPTTADLVVTDGNAIDEFDSSGSYLGQITGIGPSEETPFAGLSYVAVNSEGFLYASAGNAIDIFSPTFILPRVTYPGISGAIKVSPTEASATLNAEVDPRGGGEIKSCEFRIRRGSRIQTSGCQSVRSRAQRRLRTGASVFRFRSLLGQRRRLRPHSGCRLPLPRSRRQRKRHHRNVSPDPRPSATHGEGPLLEQPDRNDS